MRIKKITILILEIICLITIFVSSIHFFPKYNEEKSAMLDMNLGEIQRKNVELEDFQLKDFQIENTTLYSESSDPWMYLELNGESDILGIVIEINEMSVEEIWCQIFYDSFGDKISGETWVEQNLKTGENIIFLPQSTKIKHLRVDLVNQMNVAVNVGSIGFVED